MNREILFRGKRLDNGELVEGIPTYDINGNLTEFDVYKSIARCEVLEVDLETICQYTGRLDDNKKKIYEEDFVKINNDWVGRVVWSDDTTSFCVLPNDDIEHETYCLGYYIEEGYKVEVIGNIFDNPELLDKAGELDGKS